MLKRTLLGVLVVMVVASVVPVMAQASTPVPTLPSGVDPAHIADDLGNPVHATATLSGTLVTQGALWIVCDNHAVIAFDDDGTSRVTSFTVTNCTVPNTSCTASITATDLAWGDRLGFDTTNGTFRDYVNLSWDFTFGGPCPLAGTFPEVGPLFPEIEISGSSISAHFHNGLGSHPSTGMVSGPIGTKRLDGTLSGTLTSEETDSFQLANTGE